VAGERGWTNFYVCMQTPRNSKTRFLADGRTGISGCNWVSGDLQFWESSLAIDHQSDTPDTTTSRSCRSCRKLDITGSFLLAAGISLFLTGLNLGGGLYSWTDATTLCTLVIGLAILVVFGLFEWKGTKFPD